VTLKFTEHGTDSGAVPDGSTIDTLTDDGRKFKTLPAKMV